jgi:hypothetical protein
MLTTVLHKNESIMGRNASEIASYRTLDFVPFHRMKTHSSYRPSTGLENDHTIGSKKKKMEQLLQGLEKLNAELKQLDAETSSPGQSTRHETLSLELKWRLGRFERRLRDLITAKWLLEIKLSPVSFSMEDARMFRTHLKKKRTSNYSVGNPRPPLSCIDALPGRPGELACRDL